MPKRTLGLETIRYRPGRNRKQQFGDLTDIDGHDLLHLFHGWATDINPDELVNETHGRYVRIMRVEPTGRSVIIEAESGYFGEPGKTIDVRSHQVSHERNSEESATVMTRLVLVVPPGAQVGVFGIERQGNFGAGPKLIAEFKHALMSEFPDHSFSTETVVESSAWLDSANLVSVKAVAYGFPIDIGNGIVAQPQSVGRLEQTLEPERGQAFLPNGILKALRERRLRAADFIGFRGDTDVDETFVTVSRDGRKKTFNIDKTGVPSVRILLTDDGSPALAFTDLLRKSQDEVRDFYEGIGLSWQDSWRSGKWTKTAMSEKLPTPTKV